MELFRIGFLTVTITDLLDVLIVSFLLYKLYKIFRRTIVLQVLLGVLLFFAVSWLVNVSQLLLLKSILDQVTQVGAIALLIIFAPEIRRYALSLGHNSFFVRLRRRLSSTGTEREYKDIIEACETLSSARIGAIIVLEGQNDLSHIEETGDKINAEISKRLLLSIFNRTSPLHDGAVLVRGDQIVAARCVLPISDDPDIPAELGMRHRAALGMTEVSDATAVVVSEETGKVSVALAGRLKRNLSGEELMTFLTQYQQGRASLFT